MGEGPVVPTAANSHAQPVHNHFMKSTWRNDSSKWGIAAWLYTIAQVHPSKPNKPAPVFQKTDKVPAIHNWQFQRWVAIYASVPVVLHQIYAWYYQRNLTPVAAFLYYTLAYHLIAIHELNCLRRMSTKYGFLDGDKHARDEIPDTRVNQVIISLICTATFRPMLAVFLTYDSKKTPASIDFVALAIELCLYGVTLDFWFYWYHRCMHDFDALWKFHRSHHLTKHPNPLLTLFADHEQEIIDIAGIPLLTFITLKFLGLPMGFYEWWYCHQFVVFAELLGHSGLRISGSAPNPINALLRATGTELVIEDHDLHHRTGWKTSHNYGKQTRVWDRIFGTTTKRIEGEEDNVDYENSAKMPLFYN